MGKLAIETRGLKKSFGKTHAVAGVDLAVSAGGVYGVLGPNGAGKTTVIRMLATLLRTYRRGLRSHHHGPLPQQEVDAATASTWSNSDNPAHSANAITGTKPGTPETGPKCK